MSRAIPTSWDDDDWVSPRNAVTPAIASRSNPTISASEVPVVFTNTAQPKTLYKPELKILRRDAAPPPQTAPGPPTKATRELEKERKEKERKERERRYQEAKDRIFAGTPATPAEKNGAGRGKKKGRGGSGASTPRRASPPPPRSQNDSPKPRVVVPPPRPVTTGAITGFSLNSGSISAAPVKRERQEWQLRQVALDGKMLESQAQVYGYGRDEELLGDRERGLDWDEFRRDRWGGEDAGSTGKGVYRGESGGYDELEGRLENLELVAFGESAEDYRRPVADVKETRRSGSAGGVALPVREPRGPEGDGKGFAGRGRGRNRGGFGVGPS